MTQLEQTRGELERREKEMAEQRAELEGRVAMVTRQLESGREEWTKKESDLKTVSCSVAIESDVVLQAGHMMLN